MILGPEVTIRSLSPMSTNPTGFGQFSNNNYMPGIGLPCAATHFTSPGGSLGGSFVSTNTTNTVSSCTSAVSSPILSPPGPPSSLFHNYGGLPSAQHIQTGFTFTSPTQSYSLMGSPPVSIMHGGLHSPHSQHLNLHYHHHLGANPYLQTSAATTPSTAPGVGVTWQHTVPSSMPWVQTNSVTPNPVCFSDVMSSSSIITGTDPKPSCSCSPRRPKRRGTDMYEEAEMFQMPPNKVCLSEEKVAQQLQELSIDPNFCINRNKSCGFKEKKDKHSSFTFQGSWRGIPSVSESVISKEKNLKLSSMKKNDQPFKNVLPQKLLQTIIDEDENESSEKKQRSLHIVEDLSSDILAPKAVLPRKILQEIICAPTPKPCLDVVLWKPPDVLANVMKSRPQETLPTEAMSESPASGGSSLPKSALNLPDISLLSFTATSISQTFNDITFTPEEDDVMDI